MKGIKFNEQGIKGILNGSKTMTRRPIKVRTDIDKQAWIDTLIDDYSKYKVCEIVELAEVYENDPNGEWRLTGKHIKITGIKVERLQDISEEDVLKEGLSFHNAVISYTKEFKVETFRNAVWNNLPYQQPYDWNSNPYVFVYEFEVQ